MSNVTKYLFSNKFCSFELWILCVCVGVCVYIYIYIYIYIIKEHNC